jgi:uncharacterized protein YfeS
MKRRRCARCQYAKRILASTVPTVDEWIRTKDEARAKEIARRDESGHRQSLNIDRDLYHPGTKSILSDPFFWSSADDISPHGNDTGADLLGDYGRWEAKHPGEDPMRLLGLEFARSNVVPIDWLVDDEITVREMLQKNPTTVTLCNEAAIALAFAVLKFRGGCPTDIIRTALPAIQRTAYVVKQSELSNEVKAEWNVGLEKMRQALEGADHRAASKPD